MYVNILTSTVGRMNLAQTDAKPHYIKLNILGIIKGKLYKFYYVKTPNQDQKPKGKEQVVVSY